MKYIISILTVSVCLFAVNLTTSQAQSIKTGAKGGINFTNFYDGGTDYESRTGFMLGGFIKMSLPESPISIQPEAYYSQKGAETSGGGEIKLEYLEIPILLKIGLGESEVVSPNLFLGPYAGVNLNQDSGGLLSTPDETENIDFGGVIGAGLDVEAGSSIFTFDVRYGFGLSPVFQSGDEKNSAFAIVAGISLPDK